MSFPVPPSSLPVGRRWCCTLFSLGHEHHRNCPTRPVWALLLFAPDGEFAEVLDVGTEEAMREKARVRPPDVYYTGVELVRSTAPDSADEAMR